MKRQLRIVRFVLIVLVITFGNLLANHQEGGDELIPQRA